MVLQVISCTLATAGLILFLWCLIGAFLLPVAGPNLTAVFRASADAPELEQTVRSFSWLYETGIVEMPMQIVDCGMDDSAAQRAQKLALEHPYIQIIREPNQQGQVDESFGSTAGTDPRQCGGGGVPE